MSLCKLHNHIFKIISYNGEFRDIQSRADLPVDRERELNLKCIVSALAQVPMTPENQFGVNKADIEKWKRYLCQTEIDGRKIRNHYRIEWTSAHPLAEHFLWKNLANKVSKFKFTIARDQDYFFIIFY